MDYKTLLLSGQGRIGRKTYWMTGLAVGAVTAVVWMVAAGLMSATGSADGLGAIGYVALIVAIIVSAVALWASIVLGFKRCHDRDMSGWMMLIPLYNMWVMIQVYFLAGTPGPNRFGPDPLGAPALGYSVA